MSSSANSNADRDLTALYDVVPLLRKQLGTLRDLLSREHIDASAEYTAHALASRQAERLSNIVTLLGITTPEPVCGELVEFERLSALYDTRRGEYERSSRITRAFLTPRTRFREAWAREEELPPPAHGAPELLFLAIIAVVFVVLAVLAAGPSPRRAVECTVDALKRLRFSELQDRMHFAVNRISHNKTHLVELTRAVVSKLQLNFHYRNYTFNNTTLIKTEL